MSHRDCFVASLLAMTSQGRFGGFRRPKSKAAGRGPPPVRLADHLLRAQRGDVALAHLEPAGEHLVGVLAELWRRLQFGRLPVEAYRPALAFPVAVGVMHDLHD